jgi:hypothetical protein
VCAGDSLGPGSAIGGIRSRKIEVGWMHSYVLVFGLDMGNKESWCPWASSSALLRKEILV